MFFMARDTAIEWTETTWNPVTGCTEVSPGCDNCYARRFSERFRGVVGHPFEYGFDLILRPNRISQPLSWKAPRTIFVNSMSDLFHKGVPTAFVDQVFDTMEKADWHTFQILTKRSSKLRDYVLRRYSGRPTPAHIWIGVSVEDAARRSRIQHLRDTPAVVRFLSLEPLIGSLGTLNLDGISWTIVGGESGPKSRPIDPLWVRDIRDQCASQGVAFFFKQWGGARPKSGGRTLDGREWSEYPSAATPA